MTAEWSLPAWAVLASLAAVLVVLASVVLAALSAVRRAAARADQSASAAHALSDDLRAQVGAIEQRLGAQTGTDDPVRTDVADYVITRFGDPDDPDDTDGRPAAGARPTVDGPLFADLVLRESVVQAASFAAGLRRALAPAHLNQVRFEMRREIKRARKQRRADLRQARREYEARGRDGVHHGAPDEGDVAA